MNKIALLGLSGLLAQTIVHAEPQVKVDDVIVTATRFEDAEYAHKPTNLTVIREEDIKSSPATTLPELLRDYAGINTRDLYGNNGSRVAVDLRGFGASGGQNTLVLVDGKRLNDVDLTEPQWPAVPLSSIKRVEVVRGGGAVMFGAGATGGIINIITKSATELGDAAHIAAGVGSYGSRDVQGYANTISGNFGINVAASHHISDGYRDNNHNEQNDAAASLGWMDEHTDLRLDLSTDRQRMRLPGARRVQPSIGLNEAEDDWRGAQTPLDWATRDGQQLSLEGGWRGESWEGRMGLAYRDKEQHSYYDFGGFPSYREDYTKVISWTPRLKISFGAAAEHSLIAGVDVNRWDYSLHTSDSTANISRPINRVGVRQNTVAFYLQDYTRVAPATTVSLGYRSERNRMEAGDVFDVNAPGGLFGSGAPAGDQTRREYATEIGLRHAFTPALEAYGKVGRSFRFANVDELYEFSAVTFQQAFQFLRPQTSIDKEVGLDAHSGNARLNASLYHMRVTDEIHLDPFFGGPGNTNLPPLSRYGMELDSEWRKDQLALHGSYTLAYARFNSGSMNGIAIGGNNVPLVSRNKLNLNASWAFTPATSLHAVLHAASRQYMDNDENNTLGRYIPGYSITNLKLMHKLGEWNMSATVNNLFDKKYYNYAVRSQFTADRYALYPLPERNFWVAVEYDFK